MKVCLQVPELHDLSTLTEKGYNEYARKKNPRLYVHIADALNNMHPHSGSDSQYAKGMLVGTVNMLIGIGLTFDRAIAICGAIAPKTIIAGSVPVHWLSEFGVEHTDSEKTSGDIVVWERKFGRE